MFKYVGKAIEVKYETGYHFKIEYLSEDRLRWTSLEERTDGAPMTGEETFYLNQQSEDIFTFNWIEDTGLSVSQNVDFKAMTVYAFMSWNDATQKSGRGILAHKGIANFLD